MAQADGGGIVVGIRAPLILTRRADNIRIRLASCAIAVRVVHARRWRAGAATVNSRHWPGASPSRLQPPIRQRISRRVG